MKILNKIPTYLLALIFLVFGSNYFLQFIPLPPMQGDAGTFMGVLFTTKFLLVVKSLEIIIAILLLISKTRALGFLLIAPIALNILLFEVLIAHQPGIGILLVLLTALGIVLHKNKYLSILQ